MLQHNKQDGGAKDGGAHQYLKRPRSSSQNECRRRSQPVALIPVAKSTEATAPLAVPESAGAAIAASAFNKEPLFEGANLEHRPRTAALHESGFGPKAKSCLAL
ncbi:hypothetical protein [Bradyrhizobium archetypum]|uniref:Uncharacterized protein n=1 Tax=Bradyrhizobium archetypum TaxID=2721160 RepID=A0A7Y4H5K4_9BRAD|nr:hypothetical protein [Bradyrhizobium archetypum]NOJ47798.1 hypothetical protein [Bradyrhizobium archetypum]